MTSSTPDPTDAVRKLLRDSQHAKVMDDMQTQVAYLAGLRRQLIAEGWSWQGAEVVAISILQNGGE